MNVENLHEVNCAILSSLFGRQNISLFVQNAFRTGRAYCIANAQNQQYYDDLTCTYMQCILPIYINVYYYKSLINY